MWVLCENAMLRESFSIAQSILHLFKNVEANKVFPFSAGCSATVRTSCNLLRYLYVTYNSLTWNYHWIFANGLWWMHTFAHNRMGGSNDTAWCKWCYMWNVYILVSMCTISEWNEMERKKSINYEPQIDQGKFQNTDTVCVWLAVPCCCRPITTNMHKHNVLSSIHGLVLRSATIRFNAPNKLCCSCIFSILFMHPFYFY